MMLDRAKDLYDAGKQKGGADPEQTAKRQSADGQGLYSDRIISFSHGLCFSAQVVSQSVGKVARVAAKPTSHTAKVVFL